MIWKVLTIANSVLVAGIYFLIFVAIGEVKKKKKQALTKVTVKQVSPKK